MTRSSVVQSFFFVYFNFIIFWTETESKQWRRVSENTSKFKKKSGTRRTGSGQVVVVVLFVFFYFLRRECVAGARALFFSFFKEFKFVF